MDTFMLNPTRIVTWSFTLAMIAFFAISISTTEQVSAQSNSYKSKYEELPIAEAVSYTHLTLPTILLV